MCVEIEKGKSAHERLTYKVTATLIQRFFHFLGGCRAIHYIFFVAGRPLSMY